ncbi:MAG: amidophosphoribosyltransferase [Verrucomicrobiota bacterium]
MSDPIKHECGIAMVRLLKPLEYFQDRYGSGLYGFQKLFLLMEKQHNRGQDGVGIGCCKLGVPLGQPYMFRSRSAKSDSLASIFQREMKGYEKLRKRGLIDPKTPSSVKSNFDFGGECLVGHLRYGTSGRFGEGSCHPYLRRSNWPTKSLMVMGNFNMTNAQELNETLVSRGQHPVFETDTQTVLEELGFHLDESHQRIYHEEKERGRPGREIPGVISERQDVVAIIRDAARIWDGGYAIAGLVGNGDAFAFRDPNGIRPLHYLWNDELVAVSSERVPLMTAFGTDAETVKTLLPGHALAIKHSGEVVIERFVEERNVTPCSFERIYFSRGNDPHIYEERKNLGAAMVPQIMESIGSDLEHTVFSFVPNTAEIAYHGLMDGLRLNRRATVKRELLEASQAGELSEERIDELVMRNWPRGEKVAHKDIKLRTFIAKEDGRDQLVSHVYDITYGVVDPDDHLVVIDDSIVRGTTLKKSILMMLSRTRPKKIVIASTAPQIRYPDCYGIDMSELGKFIAFQAAVILLKKAGRSKVLEDTYEACLAELEKEPEEMRNCVKDIYAPFSPEEISGEISQMVYPTQSRWKGEVEIIYQSIENLHEAIPNHQGDWYFTGNYPTPGGTAVCNRAFVHYQEDRKGRAYDLWF